MSSEGKGNFRFGVATASLGMHHSHTLEIKLKALQQAGYHYVAIGFGDYVSWVRQHSSDLPASTAPPDWAEGGEPDPSDDELWEAMYDATPRLKALAEIYGLRVVGVQPLNQFDGWPKGHPREEWSKRKAERWVPLLSMLGCEFLQVGSNNKPDASTDLDKYASDLRWIADLGAKQNPPVKIAYELWCFSVHINTWEQCWDIIKLADHPNLGLCLDVAHFPLAPEYGWDVRTGEGYSDTQFKSMLDRLRKVPKEHIAYVEVSDMVLPSPPLGQGSPFDAWDIENASTHGRGDKFTWTVCGRPLPLVGRNAGAIKPGDDKVKCGGRVPEALGAILDTGFEGLIVMEFFEAKFMSGDDETIPARYANAAAKSQELIWKEMGR